MTINLPQLTPRDLQALRDLLRTAGASARTMEEAAQLMTHRLFEDLGDGNGRRACALVRVFRTETVAKLPPSLRALLLRGHPGLVDPQVRCLTMLGTAGSESSWNRRSASSGHQVIPLPTSEAIGRLPMVSQLLHQLGIDVASVVATDPSLLRDRERVTYNAFHIETALGSPYVPSQEFVRAHQIVSVVGFGGVLPFGEVFAFILFSRVLVTARTADLLQSLALAAKVAFLPFDQQGLTYDASQD